MHGDPLGLYFRKPDQRLLQDKVYSHSSFEKLIDLTINNMKNPCSLFFQE